MPAMRMEARGAEVLDLCHRRRHAPCRWWRVRTCGRRLTLVIGRQAASLWFGWSPIVRERDRTLSGQLQCLPR